MFLLEENQNPISFSSQMLNLQNEKFLNGLDKLNERKVNTIKSSNIVCVFFICISIGQEFVLNLC